MTEVTATEEEPDEGGKGVPSAHLELALCTPLCYTYLPSTVPSNRVDAPPTLWCRFYCMLILWSHFFAPSSLRVQSMHPCIAASEPIATNSHPLAMNSSSEDDEDEGGVARSMDDRMLLAQDQNNRPSSSLSSHLRYYSALLVHTEVGCRKVWRVMAKSFALLHFPYYRKATLSTSFETHCNKNTLYLFFLKLQSLEECVHLLSFCCTMRPCHSFFSASPAFSSVRESSPIKEAILTKFARLAPSTASSNSFAGVAHEQHLGPASSISGRERFLLTVLDRGRIL